VPDVKPILLVVELWGLGDLIIAAQFLRAAGHRQREVVQVSGAGKL
jgi:hypothetical protein